MGEMHKSKNLFCDSYICAADKRSDSDGKARSCGSRRRCSCSCSCRMAVRPALHPSPWRRHARLLPDATDHTQWHDHAAGDFAARHESIASSFVVVTECDTGMVPHAQMVRLSGALHRPLVELRVGSLGRTLLPDPKLLQPTGMCTLLRRNRSRPQVTHRLSEPGSASDHLAKARTTQSLRSLPLDTL